MISLSDFGLVPADYDGLGHGSAAVLLPGFAINWEQD